MMHLHITPFLICIQSVHRERRTLSAARPPQMCLMSTRASSTAARYVIYYIVHISYACIVYCIYTVYAYILYTVNTPRYHWPKHNLIIHYIYQRQVSNNYRRATGTLQSDGTGQAEYPSNRRPLRPNFQHRKSLPYPSHLAGPGGDEESYVSHLNGSSYVQGGYQGPGSFAGPEIQGAQAGYGAGEYVAIGADDKGQFIAVRYYCVLHPYFTSPHCLIWPNLV